MALRKRRRLLSVLLTGLAGAGLLTVGFGLTPFSGSVFGSMFGFGLKGDFSLTSDSNFVAVPQGYTGTVTITVTSLNHFGGDLSTTVTMTTSTNAPVVKTSQSSISLRTDGTASFSITVTTTSSTAVGYYNITVQGKTGTLSHSMIISVHVTPPPPPPTPDFYLSSNASSLTATQGSYATATLVISSILSYSGNVALTASIYPSGANSPSVSLNLTSLHLPAVGTNMTNIIVNTFNATLGSYTISITGTSGMLGHSLYITLAVTPFTGYESLSVEFAVVSSPTNATLNIRNIGSVTTSLVSYYVTDISGDRYTLANWNGPIMNPNGLGIARILIGASCSSCVLSGSAFAFTTGNSYGITLITSYNNRFTFTITLSSSQEALSMDAYSFVSATNVTLYIRNTGTSSIQLASYYVKDASGDQYALVSYAGPTIAVNQVVPVSITIGSSCSGCTLIGSAFTFTLGYSYTILLVTSRNTQFMFTVVR